MAATRLQLSIGLALTVLVCVTLAEPVERHSHASGAGEKIHGKAHQQQHASVPDREDDIDLDPFVDTSKVSDDEVVEDPAATEEPKEEEAPVNPLPQNGTYVPSNCTSCRFRIREELRQLNLESIKEEILNKLGMRNAPNMTGRELPKIPPLHNLLDKYGMQNDAPKQTFQPGTVFLDEDDDFHARTEKVIAFAQPPPHLRHVQQGQNIQYFKFSEKITRNRVLDSQLWLYLKDEEKTEKVITIEVLQVMKIKEGESLTMTSVLSAKRALRQGWITLDVRKLMAHWFKYPKENLGIVVRTEDEADKKYVVTYPSEEEFFIPFVQVHMADGRKHRTKRTIGINCNENSHETRCCRYPLTVDFETFGWDWIIAPKKYEANYCSGECPYVFLQKYPHTHIVQQANPAGTAGPCCAPRKMSHISMLYFDNEFNIIYGLLPGMVVDRCGCS